MKTEREAPHLAWARGDRVMHVPTGLVGDVRGYKNEGLNRGFTVTVRDDDGRDHHFRPHRIARAEK